MARAPRRAGGGQPAQRHFFRQARFEPLESRCLLSVGTGKATLTSGVARAPVAMAVDDSYVYWIEAPGAVDGPSGAIKRVDKVHGGDATTMLTLAPGRGSGWDMVLDSTHVYFVDGYGLYRVAKIADHGFEETVSTEFGVVKPPFGSRYGQNPSSMAIDPAYSTIYVTNYDGANGSVQKVNKMGGPVTTLVETSFPTMIATDNTYVHWAEQANLRIRNTPLVGGAVSSDVPYTSYPVRAMVSDLGGSLYYTTSNGRVDGVRGGSLVAYAGNWSSGLAVDPLEGNIFYGASDASIRYVPKTTLPVQKQLVTLILSEDLRMVSDRNFLYWSEIWGGAGTINRIPKPAVTGLPNNWPQLDAIPTQSARVGLPLGFYAHATDIAATAVPAGAAAPAAAPLQYSLESGAPAGAAIDPDTGYFSWTPTTGQAGTYTITVRVVDNGTPPLDDRKSFTVSVAPAAIDSCGVYDPAESKFYLRYLNSEGPVNAVFGFGVPYWKPLTGDWNGDGVDTIGLFQPEAAHFYLRNSNSAGDADLNFGYGDPSQGAQYILVMGDWNGDGVDTVGLYHKASATWFLRNSNSEGVADLTVGFGVPGSNWVPLVGDWNGDHIATIGLYDPATGMFYLRNSHTTGMADIAFPYGAIGSGWTPLIGDWDGNGEQSAGFYQPGAASHFHLRNSFTAGVADMHYGLGFAGVQPIVGNWLGNGVAAAAIHMPLAMSQSGSVPGTLSSPVETNSAEAWPTDADAPLGAESAGAEPRPIVPSLAPVDPRAADQVALATLVDPRLDQLTAVDDLAPAIARPIGSGM